RTRVSFDVAITQLGGHCIQIDADREIYDLEPQEQVVMDGPAEEHVKDAARTLSRYVDVLGVRHLSKTGDWERDGQDLLLRSYAKHATVPVINLESTQHHPCQAFADMMTMQENLIRTQGRKLTLAWSNHPEPKSLGATHSVALTAATMGMDITLAYPLGFELDPEVMEDARRQAEQAGGTVRVINDLAEAADGCDVLYARSWGSHRYWGDPEREAMVKRSLQSWRVDRSIMARTNNAIFMHPLPVRRNVVATDNVLDGERSVIYDQAENRVHVQKALLVQLLK
ncbi:MAG: N-acetylornithine carbamoyltransferase, partial [Planctomycetes bacterium]|nr:N-acetylornithine carbamoyltransferase [Planctomycetota bacterium]